MNTNANPQSILARIWAIAVLTILVACTSLQQQPAIEQIHISPLVTDVYSTKKQTEQIVFIKDITSSESIYTMDPNGNDIAQLTSIDCMVTPLTSPVWAPDGKTIAFGCKWSNNDHNLCIIDSQNTQTPCPVTNLLEIDNVPPVFCSSYPQQSVTSIWIESISWSPDGQQLVFTCPYSGKSKTLVCTLALSNGNIDCWPISLVSGEEEDNHPVKVDWSPTHPQLALGFLMKSEATYKIYLADLNGQNSVFLADGVNPRWSPDGKQILFFHKGGMYVIDRDGSNRECLYQSPNLNDFILSEDPDKNPLLAFSTGTWSPDKQFIAFSAGRNTSGSSTGIYKLDLNTKSITILTLIGDGEFREPDWSP